jgi:hypothetical protein
MVRTGIPVSVWEQEGDAVIYTAFDLLSEADRPRGVDLDDPATIPAEWLP